MNLYVCNKNNSFIHLNFYGQRISKHMLLKRNNSNTYILDYFLPIKKVKKVSCICTAIEYQSNTLPKRDNFNLPIPDHF